MHSFILCIGGLVIIIGLIFFSFSTFNATDSKTSPPTEIISEQPESKQKNEIMIKKRFGAYSVKIYPAGSEKKGKRFSLYIERLGAPVIDLEPYKQTLGESTLVNTETAEKFQVFSMTHDFKKRIEATQIAQAKLEGETGPWLNFEAPVQSGHYKINTEFSHQGTIVHTEFIVRL